MIKYILPRLFTLVTLTSLGFNGVVATAGEPLPLPAYKIERSNIICGSSGPASDWLGRYDGAWNSNRGPLKTIIIVTKVEETIRGCDARIVASFDKSSNNSGANYIQTFGTIIDRRLRFKTNRGTITGRFIKKKGKFDKTRLVFDHSRGGRMIGVRR